MVKRYRYAHSFLPAWNLDTAYCNFALFVSHLCSRMDRIIVASYSQSWRDILRYRQVISLIIQDLLWCTHEKKQKKPHQTNTKNTTHTCITCWTKVLIQRLLPLSPYRVFLFSNNLSDPIGGVGTQDTSLALHQLIWLLATHLWNWWMSACLVDMGLKLSPCSLTRQSLGSWEQRGEKSMVLFCKSSC